MSSIVLIDGNPLIWRSYYTSGMDGDGIVHGIIRSISSIVSMFDGHYVMVFWDRGKSRWRSEIYEKYKSNRSGKKEEVDMEELHRQTDISTKFIEYMGIRQIWVRGVEADDLISWFSSYLIKEKNLDVVISTTDKDMWQLIDGNKVKVYDPIGKRVIDELMVVNEFGVPPKRIPDYKALVGDKSDNIDGVKGIGKKTALDLINKYGELVNILNQDNHKELMKYKRTAVIMDSMEDISTAHRLTTLSEYTSMRWFMNDKERLDLSEMIGKNTSKNDLGVRVMSEKFGDIPMVKGKILPLSSEMLSGINTFVDKNEEEKYSSLSSIDMAIKGCNKCDLRSYCGSYGPTLPEGYNDVEIMVIGRNPGRDELEGGRPFIGKAGARLDQFLSDVGLTRREVWITNTCKCYSENNRPITHGEMMACSWYIRNEIELIKPKFIMVFGNEAMSVVTPYGSGVAHHCGEILKNPHGLLLDIDIQAWVAICVHPSAALRSKKYEMEMVYATEKIKVLLDGVR